LVNIDCCFFFHSESIRTLFRKTGVTQPDARDFVHSGLQVAENIAAGTAFEDRDGNPAIAATDTRPAASRHRLAIAGTRPLLLVLLQPSSPTGLRRQSGFFGGRHGATRSISIGRQRCWLLIVGRNA
jgi:hypothetical protein